MKGEYCFVFLGLLYAVFFIVALPFLVCQCEKLKRECVIAETQFIRTTPNHGEKLNPEGVYSDIQWVVYYADQPTTQWIIRRWGRETPSAGIYTCYTGEKFPMSGCSCSSF